MDRNKAESLRQEFSRYTAWAKGEADRARHKTRVVAYGGI
jgi:lysine/ornithine N-monooxygenase